MSLLEDTMHSAEVLKKFHLDPLEMRAIAFARCLGMLKTRIERLIKSTTGITLATALRLARLFKRAPASLENLQTNSYRPRVASENGNSSMDERRCMRKLGPELNTNGGSNCHG